MALILSSVALSNNKIVDLGSNAVAHGDINMNANSITKANDVTSNTFSAVGVDGASASSRYVGATVLGAPKTGIYQLGDWTIDQTGNIWICNQASSDTDAPTWIGLALTSVTGNLNMKGCNIDNANEIEGTLITVDQPNVTSLGPQTSLGVSGIVGSEQPSRYVGATNRGKPSQGSYIAGDFIVDISGNIWVCTSTGEPGTWVPINPAAV